MGRFIAALCAFFLFVSAAPGWEDWVTPDCPASKHGRLPNSDDLTKALSRHVRRGMVDYPALGEDPDFKKYLAAWDCFERKDALALSLNERKALNINLYNCSVIVQVLRHSPVRNVKKLLSFDTQKPFIVAGQHSSIKDFFKRALGPQDPRILFALADGTMIGPALREEAYIGSRIDEQLDDQVRRFFTSRNKFHIEVRKETLYLSKLFTRNESYFNKALTKETILTFIQQHLTPEELEDYKKTTVRFFLRDDFSLNGESHY